MNGLQEALEGARDRGSYLAERVAASVGGVPDPLSDLRARALGIFVFTWKNGGSEITADIRTAAGIYRSLFAPSTHSQDGSGLPRLPR